MTTLRPPSQQFLAALKSLLGPSGWKAPSESQNYFEDPRDRFTGRAALIVLPETVETVSRIVRLCNEHKVGIIPFCGGTGVVAGQLEPGNEDAIVVSLKRMNSVRAIRLADDAIIAEAGCILSDIRDTANEHGKVFPLSMASEGSCRIGGNLATNAGGIQVLRYGNTRDLCLGIEVVLPDGSILSDIEPLRKNNTGYDLRHLLIGSEGTLGIITAACLKLSPAQSETTTIICALNRPSSAVALLHSLRSEVGDAITCFELMCGFGMDLLKQHFPEEKYPFDSPYDWFALIEVQGVQGTRTLLENSLAAELENGLVFDAIVAQSVAQREALWRLRELTPEANRLTGAICNSDTAVPISQINEFIATTHAALKAIDPGVRINCYGHIGDGNIHYNVFPPADVSKQDYLEQNPNIREAVRMAINETTHSCGGTISAEHGIGRLKIDDLEKYAPPAKMAAMRAIKKALDPNGIMNPGAMFSN